MLFKQYFYDKAYLLIKSAQLSDQARRRRKSQKSKFKNL